MSSLTDILTALKNGVTGINNVAQALNKQVSTNTSSLLTSKTLVIAGSGRVFGFAVTVAGSTTGTLNDSATTTAAAASNALVALPNTTGYYPVNFLFVNGLVVTPGTGQSVNVTYSTNV